MWTFVLNDVEFREVGELVKVDKVKVVACDGKGLYYLSRFRVHVIDSLQPCKSLHLKLLEAGVVGYKCQVISLAIGLLVKSSVN